MKICFYLQRNWALSADAIAAELRDQYSIGDFCGYVSTRTSYEYLKKDGLAKYTELILDEDIFEQFRSETLDLKYLERFEREYGTPNLWPFITSDRILTSSQLIREYPFSEPLLSHEDTLRVVQIMSKRIVALLEKEKPDAVVFSVVGSLASQLMYHIARRKGIKALVLFPCLFQSRYIFSEFQDHFRKSDLTSVPSESAVAEAKLFLKTFRASPKPYDRFLTPSSWNVTKARQFRFLLPAKMWRSVRAVVHEIRHNFFTGIARDYSTVKPYYFILDRIKRKLDNLRGATDLYDAVTSVDKYAFFPLQYEPEVSLSVQAPFVTDQIEVIRMIARSLPVGWKLYVKEHPQMVEYRRRAYYKKLKTIPNVKLIDPRTVSFGLIKDAQLVVVISGSVGFESVLLGKPVITLGNQFFNELSFVKHCSTPEQLPGVVEQQLHDFTYSEDELVHFLASIIDSSTISDVQYLWYRENSKDERRKGLRPLAALLAKKLKAASTNTSLET